MVKKIYDKVCYLRRKEKQNMVFSSSDPQPSSSRTQAGVMQLLKQNLGLTLAHDQNRNGISWMKNMLKTSFPNIMCGQRKKSSGLFSIQTSALRISSTEAMGFLSAVITK